MGLFKPTVINETLSSIFGRSVRREDLKSPESNESPAAVPESNASENTEPVATSTDSQSNVAAESSESDSYESAESLESDVNESAESEESEESENDEDAKPPKDPSSQDADLEEQYFRGLMGDAAGEKETTGGETETSGKKIQETPHEDEQDKSEREVFVGNVPYKVITDNATFKAFRRLFVEAVTVKPSDKKTKVVESLRFRSIAFSEILPRRAAFIKQKLHPSRDAVNAYVRFGTKEMAHQALSLNGHEFEDHHLRVDSAASPAPVDNKRSVFVGNLDFEATEEALWRHFAGAGDIENVRIVRDGKTNVGKGFAYVQFRASPSVDVAVLLNGKECAGRPLRVMRAKKILKRDLKRSGKPGKTASDANPRKPKTPSASPSKDRSRTTSSEKTQNARSKKSILEGERASADKPASLGRKRKARHAQNGTNRRAKRAKTKSA